jgi:hypothetical protein
VTPARGDLPSVGRWSRSNRARSTPRFSFNGAPQIPGSGSASAQRDQLQLLEMAMSACDVRAPLSKAR